MLKGKDNWMEPCVDFDSYLIFFLNSCFLSTFYIEVPFSLSTSDMLFFCIKKYIFIKVNLKK
jgi:hypothetical protein